MSIIMPPTLKYCKNYQNSVVFTCLTLTWGEARFKICSVSYLKYLQISKSFTIE